MVQLHVGWMFTYLFILLGLFGAEMYAIGANSQYALTNVTTALVQRAPWAALPILAFLFWLFLHFAIRLGPVLLGKQPMTWI